MAARGERCVTRPLKYTPSTADWVISASTLITEPTRDTSHEAAHAIYMEKAGFRAILHRSVAFYDPKTDEFTIGNAAVSHASSGASSLGTGAANLMPMPCLPTGQP